MHRLWAGTLGNVHIIKRQYVLILQLNMYHLYISGDNIYLYILPHILTDILGRLSGTQKNRVVACFITQSSFSRVFSIQSYVSDLCTQWNWSVKFIIFLLGTCIFNPLSYCRKMSNQHFRSIIIWTTGMFWWIWVTIRTKASAKNDKMWSIYLLWGLFFCNIILISYHIYIHV